MAPNSIIQFDNDDVAEVLSIEDNPGMPLQVKIFSQYQCVKKLRILENYAHLRVMT